MVAVEVGMFSTVDATGQATCHPAGARKSGYDAKRRNAAKALFREAIALAGLGTATHGKCAVTGRMLPYGVGVGEGRSGMVDFGHIRPDGGGWNGAYCMCNAVPVENTHNRDNGDNVQTMPGWTAADVQAYRAAVRVVALRNMPKTKAARTV